MRVPLESQLAPLEVLRLLRDDDRPFALVGAWAGGGAVLGSQPVRVAQEGEDPFALLDEQPPVASDEQAVVGGGWFGYLGYALGERLERLPPAPPRRVRLPPFALAFYDHVLRRDRDGRWYFESLGDPARDARLGARLELFRDRLSTPAPPPSGYALGEFRARPGRRGHSEAVRWCRRYIGDGDLLQANLCLRLEADLHGDALDLFAAAAEALEPERGAYVAGPWGAVASLSPELFLERAGRSVRTRPIKGTRARTPEARAELLASEKDRAENVMIVDLMRNDIGRSSAYGTVRVTSLAEAVPGPGVWHLVSEVAGTLAQGVTDAGLVRGSFPPGSVTGAPKIKAMRTIAELESTGREAYTGAVGFASPVAGLELNVAIRTFEAARGKVWLGAGGGITWGSDPDSEYLECLTKAAPLLAAVGGELAADPDGPAVALPAPPERRARPDPGRGVFETILAVDGEPLLVDEHLRRLEVSVRELYGEALPADVAARVRAAAAATCRIRVVAAPGAEVAVECVPVERRAMFPDAPAELRPLVLPGGLGPHKWVDRGLVSGPVEPLIADLDGELLETGSGNLFIVEGDALVTPPADGRIRPGATRGALLGAAAEIEVKARIEPVGIARARGADGLFRTSAVRGLESVSRCHGVGEWPVAPVAARLAACLRRRWT